MGNLQAIANQPQKSHSEQQAETLKTQNVQQT